MDASSAAGRGSETNTKTANKTRTPGRTGFLMMSPFSDKTTFVMYYEIVPILFVLPRKIKPLPPWLTWVRRAARIWAIPDMFRSAQQRQAKKLMRRAVLQAYLGMRKNHGRGR